MKIIINAMLVLILSSCAVYKASQNDGTSVEEIRKCRDKVCILALGAQNLEEEKLDNGGKKVIYRVKKRKHGITYVRALLHGAADIATIGLWEIVATPIEGYISNEEFLIIQVMYDKKDHLDRIVVQGQ